MALPTEARARHPADMIQSITTRDYPQVQASILVIALTYILVNFISDLLYAVADPRIKLE